MTHVAHILVHNLMMYYSYTNIDIFPKTLYYSTNFDAVVDLVERHFFHLLYKLDTVIVAPYSKSTFDAATHFCGNRI